MGDAWAGAGCGEAWIYSFIRVNSLRLGASGAGKTLLLRALAGLDAVQEGRVMFEDEPLDEWPAPLYRSKVSYLHQRPALFGGSVEDNLRRPFELQIHKDRRFDREEVVAWLERLNRNERFLDLSATTLSGGEAQLTALLRALQLGPQVLLLDEATASLDPETVLNVESLLKDWLGTGARACLWTSHDSAQLERVADVTFDLTRYLGDG